MSETQRQVIQECFDGDRERDCDYCPAHCSKNGKCCFGTEFDEDDNRCASCNHNYHCSLETAQRESARAQPVERPRRIMINQQPSQSRLPVYGQPRPTPNFRPNRPVQPPPQQYQGYPQYQHHQPPPPQYQQQPQYPQQYQHPYTPTPAAPSYMDYGSRGGLIAPSERLLTHLKQHGAVPISILPIQTPEEFWKGMGMHMAWGAGEGMLEMALGFMRARRPL
jgi:hypothetical protein